LLDGEKILITGVTGKIALPIARALAGRNEVWGAARLRNPQDSDNLVAAGTTPLPLDMYVGDVSSVPTDFTYVFHAAVDPVSTTGSAALRQMPTTPVRCFITAGRQRVSCCARPDRSTGIEAVAH
jgi:UDP-glucuronate 4-epimerase